MYAHINLELEYPVTARVPSICQIVSSLRIGIASDALYPFYSHIATASAGTTINLCKRSHAKYIYLPGFSECAVKQ